MHASSDRRLGLSHGCIRILAKSRRLCPARTWWQSRWAPRQHRSPAQWSVRHGWRSSSDALLSPSLRRRRVWDFTQPGINTAIARSDCRLFEARPATTPALSPTVRSRLILRLPSRRVIGRRRPKIPFSRALGAREGFRRIMTAQGAVRSPSCRSVNRETIYSNRSASLKTRSGHTRARRYRSRFHLLASMHSRKGRHRHQAREQRHCVTRSRKLNFAFARATWP